MILKSLELSGFKSFAKKTKLDFHSKIIAVVGPNGSGKSNITEGLRFVLGEQSMKSMRGKRGEDLIWSGSPAIARSSRAQVTISLNNSARVFDLDIDEVIIQRVVFRDGANEYSINGQKVRLKDITDILARANIGASGHHIISQGEADKILNASPYDRAVMIEDALGLKIYQYKKQESARKLESTNLNIAQVESLRREIAPHLKFLKKQSAKLSQYDEMRADFVDKSKEYFKRDLLYLKNLEYTLEQGLGEINHEMNIAEMELARLNEDDQWMESEYLREEQARVSALRTGLEDDRIREERALGRAEGELDAITVWEDVSLHTTSIKEKEVIIIEHKEVQNFAHAVNAFFGADLSSYSLANILETMAQIEYLIKEFVSLLYSKLEYSKDNENEQVQSGSRRLVELKHAKQSLSNILNSLNVQIQKYVLQEARIKENIQAYEHKHRKNTDKKYALDMRVKELAIKKESMTLKINDMQQKLLVHKVELGEAGALCGREVLDFQSFNIFNENREEIGIDEILKEPREEQVKRARNIERLKIRMEETRSLGGNEILTEYRDILQRDEFLERELTDLRRAKESLQQLIKDLEKDIGRKFMQGLSQINVHFQAFFEILFPLGKACVKFVPQHSNKESSSIDSESSGLNSDKEDYDINSGVDHNTHYGLHIFISIPHKRIKSIEQLSGGERALASLALVFAISQVHPPLFLILDETDAALDESNSRKYGSIIESLSEHSQLLLITHNRETMARAGALYGITMGCSGVSEALSVKIE